MSTGGGPQGDDGAPAAVAGSTTPGGGGAPADIVVPTVGRASLGALLARLSGWSGRVVVVDDRAQPGRPLEVPPGVEVVAGRARGPAAARNDGWRASRARWVVFLDDDVLPSAGWVQCLADDLSGLGPDVAGSQGRLDVPLPAGRRPTDRERDVAGLEGARWATADLAYRRDVLAAVGGFDERFPRAYREDADLGLRVTRAGWRIVRGQRRSTHPVQPAPWWSSVARQRGNADDALMGVLHGRAWRSDAGAPPGRLRRHGLVTAAGTGALAAALAGRRRAGLGLGAVWLAGTAELAWARIRPGPRTPSEVAAMAATSAVLPPVATWHRLAGTVRARRLGRVEAW